MATKGEEIRTIISADTKPFEGALSSAVKSMDNFTKELGDSFKKLNKDFKDFSANSQEIDKSFKRLEGIGKGMVTKLTLPIATLGVIITKTTADIQEMNQKFKIVFDSMSEGTDTWANSLSTHINRSKHDIKDYASAFQSTFNSLGFELEQATEISKKLTEVAFDVSAFDNISSSDVADSFLRGITGSTRGLLRYGIVINDATMQQEAFKQGLGDTYTSLTENEKMWLRYNIMVEQSTHKMGFANKEIDGFVSQMEGLKGDLKDLGAELGEVIVPIAVDGVKAIRDMVGAFSELDDKTKENIIKLAGYTALLGPLTVGVSKSITAFIKLKKAMTGVSAMKFATGAIGLLGVTAGTVELAKYAIEMKKIDETMKNMENLTIKTIDEKDYEMFLEYNQKLDELSKEGALKGFEITMNFKTGTGIASLDKLSKDKIISDMGEVAGKEYIKGFEKSLRGLAKDGQLLFGDNDNYAKAMDVLNKKIDEKNKAIVEGNRVTAEALDIQNRYSVELNNTTEAMEKLVALEEDRTQETQSIDNLVDAYQRLASVKSLNADEEKIQRQIMDEIIRLVGKNAFVYGENGKAIGINAEKIADFNKKTATAIALAANKIVLDIEVNVGNISEKVKEINKEIQIEQNKQKKLADKASSDFAKDGYGFGLDYSKVKTDNKERVDSRKRLEELHKTKAKLVENAKSEGQAIEDIQKKTLDIMTNAINSSYENAYTKTTKSFKDAEGEKLRALQDSINKQIAVINYKSAVEENTNEETIELLKKNLKDYNSYYKANLQEELNLKQRIWGMEKSIEEEKQALKREHLGKANEELRVEYQETIKREDEMHSKRIKIINEARDAEIKAIRSVIDEQEKAFDNQTTKDRIAEINSVIEAYKASGTEEGQSKYRELLNERKRLEFKIDRSIADDRETLINETFDLLVSKEEESYEKRRKVQEDKLGAIETGFEEILNGLEGITSEAVEKNKKGVDAFKTQLEGLVDTILKSANKIQVENDNVKLTIPKLSEIDVKLNNVDLTQPKGLSKTLTTNSNKVDIENNITVNGSNLSAEELSEELYKVIKNSMGEV